jgi:hypothetical protein
MRPPWGFFFALGLGACGRSSSSPRIVADPTPIDAARPTDVPSETSSALVLHAGKIIDLEQRKIVRVLDAAAPRREAMAGDAAYLVDKAGELRAFSITTGAQTWSVSTTPCSVLAASVGGAFCSKAAVVTMYDALTGKPTVLTGGGADDVTQMLAVPGHLLVLRTDHSLESYDQKTGALAGKSTFPFMPYGFRDGLVANASGACGVAGVGPDVEAACVDTLGAMRWHKTFAIRKPTDPPFTSFLVRELDTRWLVVSTWWSKAMNRGIIVRLDDGLEVARAEEEIAAAVTGPDGALEAMLVVEPGVKLLDAKGAVRWASTEKLEEGASAVLSGATLIVASFHPIATGAELRGFDAHDGKLRWKGDVELLPIAHSKYSNHVTLEIAFGRVVMHGHEAAQRYLEIFDPADGKRELADVLPLW